MNKILFFIIICLMTCRADSSGNTGDQNKILYSSLPNHRELVDKTLELAFNSGFIDTSGIGCQKIKERLEAGAYNEDYESIPGTVGEHFPNPWDQGPSYNFNGLYPFSKIPYGSYRDNSSGWKRGFYHGYDPVKGFKWGDADLTTVEWANSNKNNFSWNNAVSFYNNGQKEKAYECLGHLLHLLEDLSIPSHVNIVNHGIGIGSVKSGTVIDPDVLVLITDEYEMALAGGITIPNVTDFIPNILSSFRTALETADKSNIPDILNWATFFEELAGYTYNHSIVKKYYAAPVQNGSWGSALDANGNKIEPKQFGITPPAQIAGRWAQITIKSTAGQSGSIMPSSDMINLCKNLVPKAAEYGAGLLGLFFKIVTGYNETNYEPFGFNLMQNYPNPFNPTTRIKFSLRNTSLISLKVYDILGKEVAVLMNEEKHPGEYEVNFNAGRNNLASGIYFYRLTAGSFTSVKKMVLIK